MKQLILGDCSEILKTFEPNSIDALITDPPAGIKFMNKSWDDDRGGRDHWIEWMTGIMKECHRVMKPGAHGLVWAIPRTSHWTATALENAGFEVRDVIHHIFGQGFPKSLDISKAIDKAAKRFFPVTDATKQWLGWGTALKPAVENWILIRKSIAQKTVAQNVLTHGCGGINIDACRIKSEQTNTGRFPANLVFSHSPYCTDDQCDIECAVKMLDEQSLAGGMHSAGSVRTKKLEFDREKSIFGIGHKGGHSPRIGDSGGASRFFYCAKVSSSERNAGLEEMPDVEGGIKNSSGRGYSEIDPHKKIIVKNNHPTIKAQKLMRYLCKLITPPQGIVLDPFMGSGSTGLAAVSEEFDFIGIEKQEEYFEIAEKRIR